jgi:hypothetical protein
MSEAPTTHPESPWIPVVQRMPEPGCKVLAFFKNELGNGRRVLAHFTPARTERADDFDYNEWDAPEDWFDMDESGTSWIPEGWYEDSETQETCPKLHNPVTHWALLPDSPDEHGSEPHG